MPAASTTSPPLRVVHGAASLTTVIVEAYNEELREGHGFVGDRASRRAFRSIVDDFRQRLAETGEDPLGEAPTEEIGKRRLERLLTEGDVEAAGLVLSAIEAFAQELVTVIRRFLRLKAWRGTELIVVGGGLSAGRVGVLAIARAAVLLRAGHGQDVALRPIRHHPDKAGLIGAAHLVPLSLLAGFDAMLAVDIGGTNLRAGLVELNLKKAADLSQARVAERALWRHRDERPSREQMLARLGAMLRELVKHAGKEDLALAPVIGIGTPGLIDESGAIRRGGQNLPGNWQAQDFNLPLRVRAMLAEIDGREPLVVTHNDAVVQGLSEVPFMRDVASWGVLTVGTGLGNARFSRRLAAG